MVSWHEILWLWTREFFGISLVAACHFNLFTESNMVMIIVTFGESTVLIYGAIRSPLAQPHNLIGGHVISAIIGVSCFQLFESIPRLATAFAVATAIFLMQMKKTLHPPGGSTALIAVIGRYSYLALILSFCSR
ncbi:MAG: HPP family protein [Deltaproteobacteria bacterium]|nr:HPP family protein [Deltaproteobacteria bacterium]